jgi:hypothetical protein
MDVAAFALHYVLRGNREMRLKVALSLALALSNTACLGLIGNVPGEQQETLELSQGPEALPGAPAAPEEKPRAEDPAPASLGKLEMSCVALKERNDRDCAACRADDPKCQLPPSCATASVQVYLKDEQRTAVVALAANRLDLRTESVRCGNNDEDCRTFEGELEATLGGNELELSELQCVRTP